MTHSNCKQNSLLTGVSHTNDKGGNAVKSIYDETVDYIVKNQEMFYRLAYSYVQNKESALDVVQNAICVALEKCDTIRNPAAIRTWFYRVIVNEALQYLRSHKREISYDPQVMGEELLKQSYEEKFGMEENEIYQKVLALPPKIKTIVVLRFYEDLSLKEIAEITQENLNTVKTRLYRGLAELGKHFKEEPV
ncbi:MAG: sigma-70 family RNA polymerase sigma factor [Lachnospiraceae bacterium]|nr:sigma-70 family RNA polymerase sigma factor [Lachnospiraceae bacterium]